MIVPPSVETLFASKRGIEVLPLSFIQTHVRIVRLDLNYNRLKTLPRCICLLVSLEVLLLFSNDLRCLPTSLASLNCLRSLNLRQNAHLPAKVSRQSQTRRETLTLVRAVVAAFQRQEGIVLILCSRYFESDSRWRHVPRDIIRLIHHLTV